ncbi:MAG: flagellin lysine-N-methylase [Lachnospiraceae bacterium]|nr:flagellin lysine-N-methylase [Lachnospiraceae bacterium]
MKIKVGRISYYDDFRCLCGDCPDNCCHGWSIPLDDEALRRFRAEKGLFGLRLRLSIHGKENKVFAPLSLRCPHLGMDGLCRLQKKCGEDFLAEVCKEYPRSRMNYGPAAEFHLDLSCIHAASLFLHNRSTQEMIVKEAECSCELYGNNDDEEYFGRLQILRDGLISALRKAGSEGKEALDEALRRMDTGLRRIQDELLIHGSCSDWELKDEAGDLRLFPLPIRVLNDMMSSCFYEDWLKYSTPFLYKLCRLYYKRFDRLDYRKGAEELQRLFDKHVGEKGVSASVFADHAASLLYRRFLFSYEDYSPHLKLSDSVICINLVLLFTLLWAERYGTTGEPELAHIISVVERRIFHNEYARKDLLACLSEESRAERRKNS